MFALTSNSNGLRDRASRQTGLLLAGSLTFGVAIGANAAEPFKVTNIHFETNASACDAGIQIIFDTDGITEGAVFAPSGAMIYDFDSARGLKTMGGQTEGFLEGVEPPIKELVSKLGCPPSDEGTPISFATLFKAFPAGDYKFTGVSKGVKFEDVATLSHHIPAGPQIVAPTAGSVVPDAALLIDWQPVTSAILTANPNLGPVSIVGYHVIVLEAGGEATPEFNVDVPASETSVTVPSQYLKPSTVYLFEVLATEVSGNQTISEGFFCTTGVGSCVVP